MAVGSSSVGGATLSDSLGAGGGTAIPTGDVRNFTLNTTAVLLESGTQPSGPMFGDDGNKFYKVDNDGNSVRQYTLSTPYDVSTAGAASTFSVGSQDTTPQGVAFNLDGTKMYMVGQSSDSVHQYSLSTAWDITSATYDTTSVSVLTNSNNPASLSFNADGTKMFVSDASGGDNLDEYTLSPAFDITSASYVDSLGVSGETSNTGHAFNGDGTIVYMTGLIQDAIRMATLTVAYDLSTATITEHAIIVTPTSSSMNGIIARPDGTALYIVDSANDDVFELTTS